MRRADRLRLVVGALGLVLAACKPPQEIRPAFVREEPAAAPLDGTVVFTSQSGRLYALYGVDPEPNGRQVPLTPAGTEERAPAFSPGGDEVAFAVNDEGSQGIYVRPVRGGERRAVVRAPGVYDRPTWSPDGGRVAYAYLSASDSSWDVFVAETSGQGEPRRVTSSDMHDWYPSWSPDGDRIAFTSDRDGDDAIWVLDVESGEERKLVDSAGEDEQPSWSPDGSRIAFTSDRELERWQVWVYDVGASRQRHLVRSSSMDRFPSWSPDGRHVLVSVGYLAVYKADGGKFEGGADRWQLTRRIAFTSAWTNRAVLGA